MINRLVYIICRLLVLLGAKECIRIYIFVYLFEHTLTKLFQGLHGLEPYSCETLTSSHSKTMVAVKTVVKQHLVIHCDGCHILSTSVKGKLVKMQ